MGTVYAPGVIVETVSATTITNASGLTTAGIIATRSSNTTLEANAVGDNLIALMMLYGG